MNKRRIRPWLAILLALALLLSPGLPAQVAQAATGDGPTVSFPSQTLNSDATVLNVPVQVSGLTAANAMEGLLLEVSFDSSQLTYNNVANGSSAGGFQFTGNANAGVLKIVGFAASPVQTDGEILKLNFAVTSKTSPIKLSITRCEINDKAVNITNGNLAFTTTTPSTGNPPTTTPSVNGVKVSFANQSVATNQSEFKVPLLVSGLSATNKLEGISLKLSYNAQAVSFVDKENGTIAPGLQYLANPSAGVLSVVGFGSSAVTTDGDFLGLKFKILNRSLDPALKITQMQINDQDVPYENGQISLTGNPAVTAKTTVFFPDINVAGTNETLVVPVSILGLSATNTLDGLALKLAFDSNRLSYQNIQAGNAATGFQYFANAKGGVLTVSGFGTASVKADGEIAHINFKILSKAGGGTSLMSLSSAQVNDLEAMTKSGTITLAKAEDEVNGLKSFTVNGQKISVSDPNKLEYSVNFSKYAADLEVSAETLNVNDMIQISKTAFNSNGVATATIKVQSAKDATKIKTYTVTVINKSSTVNAELQYILINGKKVPGFAKNVTTYSLNVPDGTTSLRVVAPAADETSQVRVSGATLSDGKATVEIAVVAGNGTIKTYTVNVSTEPTSGLAVIAMNPGEEEKRFPVKANIEIDFSKALNPEVVDENNVYILNQNRTAVQATVKLSLDKKRVIIDPLYDLQQEYEYAVVVSENLVSAADENENLGSNVEWRFTTGKKEIAPTVIPDKPTNLNGKATSSFAITWNWTDNSKNETGFILKDENGKVIQKIDRMNTTVYVEKGLNPNTQYKRTVSAYVVDELSNTVESEASIPKTVKTMALKVQAPVVFARVTEITSEKIIWRWYSKGEPGALIKVYDKDMKEVGQTQQSNLYYEDSIQIDKNDKDFTRSFKIVDPSLNNLESKATTVSVVNPYYGTGKSLNAPLIKAGSLDKGTLKITIKDRSRDEQGFKIYRVNAAGAVQEKVKEVLSADVEGINKNIGVDLEGLDAAMTYRYVVKAYNSTGEGEASEILDVNEQK